MSDDSGSSLEEFFSSCSSGSGTATESRSESPENNKSVDEVLTVTGYSLALRKRWLKKLPVSEDEISSAVVDAADVKDNVAFPQNCRRPQTFIVQSVVSPFEFYLKKIDIRSKLNLDKMQLYYDEQERYLREFTIQVHLFGCYAVRDPSTKRWCRARVMCVESDEVEATSRAFVYYCDTGLQANVRCEELRQLVPDFLGTSESILLKCYLWDVMPLKNGFQWSLKDAQFFKKVLKEGDYCAAVVIKVSKQSFPEDSSNPQIEPTCGVVLFLNEIIFKNFTVNSFMVKEGYAKSIGNLASPVTALSIPGKTPFYKVDRTLYDDWNCVCDGRGSDITPADYPAKLLKFIVETAMDCKKGERNICIKCFSENHEGSLPGYIQDPDKFFPHMIRIRSSWITISAVRGPDEIYIHLEQERFQLHTMEVEMSIETKKLDKLHLTQIKPGSFVCCQVYDDDNFEELEEEFRLRRAVVLKYNFEDTEEGDVHILVSVLMLDYGSVINVGTNYIYPLPTEFSTIPSFVRRVHLDTIRPRYKRIMWSDDLNESFSKYIESYDESNPLYHVHAPLDVEIVKLSWFGQNLVYNDQLKRWIADEENENHDNAVPNAAREHDLLSTFFQSRGVDITYEVVGDSGTLWKFNSLAEDFVQRGYAYRIGQKIDKTEIHEMIHDDIC